VIKSKSFLNLTLTSPLERKLSASSHTHVYETKSSNQNRTLVQVQVSFESGITRLTLCRQNASPVKPVVKRLQERRQCPSLKLELPQVDLKVTSEIEEAFEDRL
jgi:hypothetical protein